MRLSSDTVPLLAASVRYSAAGNHRTPGGEAARRAAAGEARLSECLDQSGSRA